MASDAELIARSLTGDNDAFVEMITRHEAVIGRYLARQVGPQNAKDLQGDVWVAAYGARAGYDPAFPDARPWLYRIAVNEVRRQWRTQPPEDLVADVSAMPRPQGVNPWAEVETRVDARAALRSALAGLKPHERDVLILVAAEDLSVVEAARVLGIPSSSARRRLYRARKALRGDPQVAALLAELNNTQEHK
ncbi:DNA-directed RNA polymerase sigma-70 factor [Kineosporia sp. NBRC 101677]|nr:DNA-directed RNA polymerase sigma-70 factor [Kineosporia sp. NBRC 101677]